MVFETKIAGDLGHLESCRIWKREDISRSYSGISSGKERTPICNQSRVGSQFSHVSLVLV